MNAGRRELVLLSAAALVACQRPQRDTREDRANRPEFAGCAKVLRGPQCVLDPAVPLRVWSRSALMLESEGARITSRESEVEGGHLYTVDVPPGATLIRCKGLVLRLLRKKDRLDPARRLRARGELDAAEAVLEPLLNDADTSTRADALSLAARLRLQRGNIREAHESLLGSLRAQESVGCSSCMAHDALAATFIEIVHLRDMSSARALLTSSAPWVAGTELTTRHLYTDALLALRTGDLRGALERLEQARIAALRLRLTSDETAAREVQANTLRRLGQYDQARSRLLALIEDATDACDRARLLDNLVLVDLTQSTNELRPKPLSAKTWTELEAKLLEALRIVRGPCPRTSAAQDVLLDLALLALERGDPAGAQHRLAEARQLSAEPDEDIALRALDLEGRIALANQQPDTALEVFVRGAAHAREVQSAEGEWRASLGRARSSAALGRIGDALGAYAACEDILDREVALAPLSDGKDTFLGVRARAEAEYLKLLFEQGKSAEAFEVARRGLRRIVQAVRLRERIAQLNAGEGAAWDDAVSKYQSGRTQLEQRAKDDWRLARSALELERQARGHRRDELDRSLDKAIAALDPQRGSQPRLTPAQDELVMVLQELGAEVLVLTARGSDIQGRLVPLGLEGQSRAQLLQALADEVEGRAAGARQLRVLASGNLQELELHTLQLTDGPLLDKLSVVYALDLGARETVSTPQNALVLGDPRGDLPHARKEAATLGAALRGIGVPDVRVWMGHEAKADHVVSRLSGLDLLHVASHAELEAQSWRSSLMLAGGTTLSVGDILALRTAPRLVFLAGCETARTGSTSSVPTLSLAHAFVAAGASAAIGSTRIVADATIEKLASAFYRALPNVHGDAAQALRLAQRQMGLQNPRADWAAFRVLVP